MSQQFVASCPLCLGVAQVLGTFDFGRHNAIRCRDCGEFGVSDRADARIRGLPSDFKDDWRKKICATDTDKIFVIKVSPVGAGSNLQEEKIQRTLIRFL